MANILSTVGLMALIASLQMGISSEAVQIHISPDRVTRTTQSDVHISCVTDGINENVKEINLLEISKNDEPIAFLRQCSNITYGKNVPSQTQVVGYIDKDLSQSSINLTVMSPQIEDTGIYSCVVYYLDDAGHVTKEKASGSLYVNDDPDWKQLEMIIDNLKETIETLESQSKKENGVNKTDVAIIMERLAALEEKTRKQSEQINDMNKDGDTTVLDRVTALEEKSMNQSQEMSGLTDKVTYMSAFSVANRYARVEAKLGMVLVLPDVIMRQGPGYDEKTGVFTSPRAGLYVFHVVALATSGCSVTMDLKANTKVLARMYTMDKIYEDQSSMSSVVELVAGDRVFIVLTRGGCRLDMSQYTLFTGYLINAF